VEKFLQNDHFCAKMLEEKEFNKPQMKRISDILIIVLYIFILVFSSKQMSFDMVLYYIFPLCTNFVIAYYLIYKKIKISENTLHKDIGNYRFYSRHISLLIGSFLFLYNSYQAYLYAVKHPHSQVIVIPSLATSFFLLLTILITAQRKTLK